MLAKLANYASLAPMLKKRVVYREREREKEQANL